MASQQHTTFGNSVKTTLAALLLACVAAAQSRNEPNIDFRRLSLEQGLSQAFVTSALQDHYGYMWFGTQEGLNRFDGYEFDTFTHDPNDDSSISHDLVKAMLEDDNGVLWIGSEGGGLSRFDRRTQTFTSFLHDPAAPDSLSSNRVRALFEDSKGRFWVGTDDAGLNLRIDDTGKFQRIPWDVEGGMSSGKIWSIVESADGALWVATDGGGLNRLDPTDSSVTTWRHDPSDPGSLSSDRTRALWIDDGVLWIGTFAGLNRMEIASGEIERFEHDPARESSLPHPTVRALFRDRDDTLWVGTDGGLAQWLPETRSFRTHKNDPTNPNSLSGDRVVSVYQDQGGVLWVGTYKGLNRWQTATGNVRHYRSRPDEPNQLHGDFVQAFAETETGMVWVGTYGGGLNLFDPSTGTFQHLQNDPSDPTSLSDDRVMSLRLDRSGVLWVGTFAGGLNRLGDGRRSFTQFQQNPENPHSISSNAVTSILEDRGGALWAGTYGGGLNLLDRASGRFTHFRHDPDDPESLSSDRVMIVYEDSAANLLVGTAGSGLDLLDRASGRFTHFRHDPTGPESLSGNHILTLLEGSDGTLWIGTQGAGLNRWRPADRAQGQARFQRYTTNDGLPSGAVLGLLFDNEGALWMSTNSGLARLDPATDTIERYDASHGLQSDEFNFGPQMLASTGELYFGGVNGFNVFRPEQIVLNRHVPPVLITRVLRSNEAISSEEVPIEELQRVELGYRDHVLAFEFTALDFTAPEKNHFLYRLEGFDQDWVDAGRLRRATYTNLNPGRYTFHVKASNNDGVWNEIGDSMRITVAPPPWRTPWAYASYVALVGFIIWASVLFQMSQRQRSIELAESAQRLQHANQDLKKEISERKAKERALETEQERARMYLDTAEVLMVVIDGNGRITLVNQRGCEVLGYTEQELLQSDWLSRIEESGDDQNLRSRFLQGSGKDSFEAVVRTSAGEHRVVVWRTTPLPAENGQSGGILCSGTDITEMRWLAEAKEAAESASRSKSQFLANMSHEIRTPMGGVLGMIELLLNTALSQRQRGYVDSARRSARGLLDILNDILDLSKIEAGKLELEEVEFDVQEVVDDIVELFGDRAARKKLIIETSVAENVPVGVTGDPTRLRQILSNLVGNAIKFTESGSVGLAVSPWRTNGEIAGLRFEIRDTGVGISPRALEKIFDSFQQADGTTTRRYGGTGLGLAISRHLVGIMGGQLGVDSELDHGSTFWFEVPMESLPESAVLNRRRRLGLDEVRILVLDASTVLRTQLMRQLARWGLEASGVDSWAKAVYTLLAAAAEERPFNLVLVDSEMMSGDGPSMLESIRTEDGLHGMHVVLLDAEQPPAKALDEAHLDMCLLKPIRQSQLFDCIANLTDDSKPTVRETGERTVLAGRTVLLAEDNPVIQEIVKAMVTDLGGAISIVENGKDAVDTALASNHDLVLMDCQMPIMDGYEATRAIRQSVLSTSAQTSDQRRPIVAMTANAMAGDREKCLAAGMDDYISKPFTRETLRAILEKWLPAGSAAIVGSAGTNGNCGATGTKTTPAQGLFVGEVNGRSPAKSAQLPEVDEPICRKALASLGEFGDPDGGFVHKVIERFLAATPAKLQAMQDSLQSNDTEVLHRTAHSLKSSSAMLGAMRMSALCRDIEAMAKEEPTVVTTDMLSELCNEFVHVRLALSRELTTEACQ